MCSLIVGACNHSGACSQTARFPAHALCHWRGASCSNYLPVCSPSSGAACKRGVVLTLPANGVSKPVAGRRFCEAGFQNSSDKRRAAEMRCGHGPPAGSSERKVFANSGRRKRRAQIYVYDRISRTALAGIVPFGMVFWERKSLLETQPCEKRNPSQRRTCRFAAHDQEHARSSRPAR